MKKFAMALLSLLALFTLTACGSSEISSTSLSKGTASENTAPTKTSTDSPGGVGSEENPASKSSAKSPNILIAYFSRAGDNIRVGVVEKGNTELIAETIEKHVVGTLFHIRTVTPYPENYRECTNVAKQEKDENARPKLAANIKNIDDYDVIFLGYPNWWGDMPVAVYTFLESHDFSGKTIVPFATHEGSGLSDTVQSISNACPNAKVMKGLAIRGQVAQNSRDEANQMTIAWLRQNGFMQ